VFAIVQMRAGDVFVSFGLASPAATNAALFAAAILAAGDAKVAAALAKFRATQTEQVLAKPDPRKS
jgi:5-(carboxyamino)imidazole ribonucleotide mutase